MNWPLYIFLMLLMSTRLVSSNDASNINTCDGSRDDACSGVTCAISVAQSRCRKNDVNTQNSLEILVCEGNELMNAYHEQEKNVHSIAYKNKEISGQIDMFLQISTSEEIISNPQQVMDTLQRSESYFRETQEYVNRLSLNEKELNDVIQNILETKLQVTEESGKIQALLTQTIGLLGFTANQIGILQADINRFQIDIVNLEASIDEAQRQLARRKRRRGRWAIATVLTFGLALPGLILNEESISAAKDIRNSRIAMLNNARQSLVAHQADKVANEHNKAILELHLSHLQQDQSQLQDTLTKLQSALGDVVKYRLFLTSLSDAFGDVKVHIQHLLRNLERLTEPNSEGANLKRNLEYLELSGMDSNWKEAYNGLKETWTTARAQPAFQVTLSLSDGNNQIAELNAIKEQEWTSKS